MRQALASAGPARRVAGPDAGLAVDARAERHRRSGRCRRNRDQALTAAEEAGDLFATAHALTNLWLTRSVRRDHVAALDYIDRALFVLGDDPGYADLRSFALDDRVFALQNLDRWPEAELALRQARDLAQRSGHPERSTWAAAAVLRYWLGQWDDALAELGSDDADTPGLTYSYLRERWSLLLSRGVSALIAGRRNERTTAAQLLRQGLAQPIQMVSDRENQDFLVAAHALALEQSGEIHQAMVTLAAMLPRRDGEMTLIHQWLPDLVRLALGRVTGRWRRPRRRPARRRPRRRPGRPGRPRPASGVTGSLRPTRTRSRKLLRTTGRRGRRWNCPPRLEDLAVVLAERGRDEDARAALIEAVSRYEGLHAEWDIRRAESRLRPHGVRARRAAGARSGRAVGWEALTATEIKIAALMARGDSTSDIARSMFLSRRTVQTYISRILAKLGAKGRVDIVREALRQGLSP